jgi:hypothetical protein
MVQSRDRFCFLMEACDFFLGSGKVCGQKLKRDKTFEFGILSFVDYAHSPLAQLFQDLVVRYGLSDHEAHLQFELMAREQKVPPYGPFVCCQKSCEMPALEARRMKKMRVDNAHDLKAFLVSSNGSNIPAFYCAAKRWLGQMAQKIGLSRIPCQVFSKSVKAGFHSPIIGNCSLSCNRPMLL